MSRLLATQLTAAQLGPGIDQVRRQKTLLRQSQKRRHEDEDDDEEEAGASSTKISTVIGGASSGDKKSVDRKKKGVTLQPAGLYKKSSSRSERSFLFTKEEMNETVLI